MFVKSGLWSYYRLLFRKSPTEELGMRHKAISCMHAIKSFHAMCQFEMNIISSEVFSIFRRGFVWKIWRKGLEWKEDPMIKTLHRCCGYKTKQNSNKLGLLDGMFFVKVFHLVKVETDHVVQTTSVDFTPNKLQLQRWLFWKTTYAHGNAKKGNDYE